MPEKGRHSIGYHASTFKPYGEGTVAEKVGTLKEMIRWIEGRKTFKDITNENF